MSKEECINKIPKVLTIAGSDNSGGAGIQADQKTFQNFGVYGFSAITAITTQNTMGVSDVWPVPGNTVYNQIFSIHEDMNINAIKIGMIGNIAVAKAIVRALTDIKSDNKHIPVVLDPVLISSSGFRLLEKEALNYLIEELFPLSYIITPNLPEAETLTGIQITCPDSCKNAASAICKMGVPNVIIKGGHSDNEKAEDLLYDGNEYTVFSSPRLKSKEVHGTGCVFSSALTANLAKGNTLKKSLNEAKQYITNSIKTSKPISRDKNSNNHYIIH